jgi:hypothetical protein
VDNNKQELIHKKTDRFALFFNKISTATSAARLVFSDFSTGSTLHKKKSDRIYTIEFNRPAETRRTPA